MSCLYINNGKFITVSHLSATIIQGTSFSAPSYDFDKYKAIHFQLNKLKFKICPKIEHDQICFWTFDTVKLPNEKRKIILALFLFVEYSTWNPSVQCLGCFIHGPYQPFISTKIPMTANNTFIFFRILEIIKFY